jgi:hypothetical protein
LHESVENSRILDPEALQKAKLEERELKQIILSDLKKPQFYNDPKIKRRIAVGGGGSLFERTYRQDQMKLGYTKLLSKILESNLTVR